MATPLAELYWGSVWDSWRILGGCKAVIDDMATQREIIIKERWQSLQVWILRDRQDPLGRNSYWFASGESRGIPVICDPAASILTPYFSGFFRIHKDLWSVEIIALNQLQFSGFSGFFWNFYWFPSRLKRIFQDFSNKSTNFQLKPIYRIFQDFQDFQDFSEFFYWFPSRLKKIFLGFF